jgi:hypothetical protein
MEGHREIYLMGLLFRVAISCLRSGLFHGGHELVLCRSLCRFLFFLCSFGEVSMVGSLWFSRRGASLFLTPAFIYRLIA